MARKGKLIHFYRGARRHPKWDMGLPPNRHDRKSRRSAGRRRGRNWLLGMAFVLVLFGPVALDAASLAWRKSEGCKVWMVVDGDTVRMICPGQGFVSGRILDFDTPEMKARCPQELGKAVAATFYLHWQLWTAGEVAAIPRGHDRYGRVLTLMAIDGDVVGSRMVGAGLARWYDSGHRRGWCGSAA